MTSTTNNYKGIKATCGMTKNLGGYRGDNIQVFLDRENNEVFGIYHTQNEWTEFRNDSDIVEITTYYRPTTMRQIEADIEMALDPRTWTLAR